MSNVMHHNIRNIKGERFGKLVVLELIARRDKRRHAMWLCRCDCGSLKEVYSTNLIRRTRSCGCDIKHASTHGLSNTRPYKIWYSMKTRCFNKNDASYKKYGAKGVTISSEWMSFNAFWHDMRNSYRDDLTIDRIDPLGNYCKENCRWATSLQQANNKTNNRYFEIDGQRKSLADWCREFSIKRPVVMDRIYSGWDVYKALVTPQMRGVV